MNFKAIIFDLDGVICSTDEYHYRAWKRMADGMHIPFDRTINNRLRGVSRMESLEIILEKYEGPALTEADKQRLAQQKNDLYRESLKEMSPDDLSGGMGYAGDPERKGPEAGDWLLLKEYALHSGKNRAGRILRRGQRRQQHHPLQAGPGGVPEGGGDAGHGARGLPGGGGRGIRRAGGPCGRHARGRGRRRRAQRRGDWNMKSIRELIHIVG